MMKIFVKTLCLLVLVLVTTPASAQTYVQKQKNKAQANQQASEIGVTYAARVAKDCLDDRWETPTCLKRISESTLVMAANYGSKLKENKKLRDANKIKEHCAAATAAAQAEYPAYAMRSAYTECANMVYDITEGSGVEPDLSQYQLLVGAVQCLDKSTACIAVEEGLARFR